MTTIQLAEIYKLVKQKYFDIVGENPDVINLLESGKFECGVWSFEELAMIVEIEL